MAILLPLIRLDWIDMKENFAKLVRIDMKPEGGNV
jgi:hypothetical protein